MLDQGSGHADPPLEGGLHQIDAPAGGIHLLTPEGIRRTGGQAEATVHTRIDERPLRRMLVVERSALIAVNSQCQPPRARELTPLEGRAPMHHSTTLSRDSEPWHWELGVGS